VRLRVRYLAPAVLIFALGVLHIWLLPTNGLESLSYDSYRYLRGAESILHQGAYLDLDGGPQQVWPPGLSLLYAGLSAVSGLDPLLHVRFVNLGFYALAALALGAVLRLSGVRYWIAIAAFASVITNGVYVSMHNKLWSEPPTIALLLIVLLCLTGVVHTRGAWSLVAIATLFAAIGILFRFAMLATIPLIMLVTVVVARNRALALIPLAAPLPGMLAFELLEASRGARTISFRPTPWRDNWKAIAHMSDQFVPARLLGDALAVGVVISVLIGATVLCIHSYLTFVRGPSDAKLSAASPSQRNVDGPPAALGSIAATWTLGYAAFLLLAQAFAQPSFPFNFRILVPLFLGIIITAAAGAELLARRNRLLPIIFALPLVLSAVRGLRYTTTHLRRVPVDSVSCITREQAIAALRDSPPKGAILTNAQGLVWFALRRDTVALSRAALSTPERPSTIVWIDPEKACANVAEWSDVAPNEGRSLIPGVVLQELN
jgi:hypothetical protein